MPNAAGQACGNCQFYLQADGECLRYPPTVLGVPIEASTPEKRTKTFFPRVSSQWWCGEWKQAPKE